MGYSILTPCFSSAFWTLETPTSLHVTPSSSETAAAVSAPRGADNGRVNWGTAVRYDTAKDRVVSECSTAVGGYG